MDPAAMRRRLQDARVARLATVGADGKPHLVPITFAIDDQTLFFAVDAKPKRTADLQRLRNIAAHPEVCVLVDHYDDDWSKLWWIRVDGTAVVLDDAEASGRALELLARRYPQHRASPPPGPVVAVSIGRISSWSAE